MKGVVFICQERMKKQNETVLNFKSEFDFLSDGG